MTSIPHRTHLSENSDFLSSPTFGGFRVQYGKLSRQKPTLPAGIQDPKWELLTSLGIVPYVAPG